MVYTVKEVTWIGSPKEKKNDSTTIQVWVNVVTGIVGDTYGFVRNDTFIAECPIDSTGKQMKALVIEQATAFSANKYPNT